MEAEVIPRVHKRGGGARGLVSYLIDKDPARVAWCGNIGMPHGTDLAVTAIAMEALIEDAPALKMAAGVSARGRPLKRPVEHFSLSWPPGTAINMSAGMDAARSALKALNYEDCLAFAVAHSDTHHAHVHVGVCRVDPDTGKARGAKQNNGRILSKWALEYEREHGGIVVPGRADPAARGDAGRSARDAWGRPMKWSAEDRAVWAETHHLEKPTTAAERSRIKRKLLIRREAEALGAQPVEAASVDDGEHEFAPHEPLRDGLYRSIAPRMEVVDVEVPDVPERDWLEVARPQDLEREGHDLADDFLDDMEEQEEEEREAGKRIIRDWAAHARSSGTDERAAIREAKLAYQPVPEARAWRDEEAATGSAPRAAPESPAETPGPAAEARPRLAAAPPPPTPGTATPDASRAEPKRRRTRKATAVWPPPIPAAAEPDGTPERVDEHAASTPGQPESDTAPPPDAAVDLPWMDEPDDYDAPLPELDDPEGTPQRSAGKAATDAGAGPGSPRVDRDDRDGQRR